MKFSIIIAIVFGLLSMTLTLIEAHTVWIHNKVAVGTHTRVTAAKDRNGKGFSTDGNWAHKGYSLNIPDDVKAYWLGFNVYDSFEEDKWRGPITNDGDKCYHFHGTLENWDIYEC
ncbi:11191_t:CDS:2 [Funneliformis mosseae]|uniref:11191_t:CDS:1 n=1 Tax=Funneliformis mosseae TaxID=27381 RepID=A0A9N9HYM0_FUNMO|nr:11191_t:CDS:2 [Funneliformis mosseae]